MDIAVFDPTLRGQAVDLAVVVKTLLRDGDDDGHRLVLRRALQADLSGDAATIVEGRPIDADGARLRDGAEMQFDSLTLVEAISFGGVARQGDAFAEGNHQAFLVQIAALEIQGVDENIASVAQVCDGGGEETLGGEDGVIIPAFGAGELPKLEDSRIEGEIIKILQMIRIYLIQGYSCFKKRLLLCPQISDRRGKRRSRRAGT